MHGTEQRRVAKEAFTRFGHSCAGTIAELSYPSGHTLCNWWRERGVTDEVPIGKSSAILGSPRSADEALYDRVGGGDDELTGRKIGYEYPVRLR